jgi:inner membrane protein involved in colicin E2 resistance
MVDLKIILETIGSFVLVCLCPIMLLIPLIILRSYQVERTNQKIQKIVKDIVEKQTRKE